MTPEEATQAVLDDIKKMFENHADIYITEKESILEHIIDLNVEGGCIEIELNGSVHCGERPCKVFHHPIGRSGLQTKNYQPHSASYGLGLSPWRRKVERREGQGQENP